MGIELAQAALVGAIAAMLTGLSVAFCRILLRVLEFKVVAWSMGKDRTEEERAHALKLLDKLRLARYSPFRPRSLNPAVTHQDQLDLHSSTNSDRATISS